MSKKHNSDDLDPDIAECKQDILRAGGANGSNTGKANLAPGVVEPKSVSSNEQPNVDKTSKFQGLIINSDEPARKKQEHTMQVPRFDLAEDIMAEQRRLIALRRKGPQKSEAHVQGQSHGWQSGDQQQIITEIVARDIEKMCLGDYSDQTA